MNVVPSVGQALGFLGHPGLDQRPQRLGYRLERDGLEQVLVHHPLGGLAGEQGPAGQALVKGGRGRVHVRGRGGRAAAHLLRRRVRDGARRVRLVPGPHGDPEVGQLAHAVAVNQDVLWLIVAVHDTALVRGGQAEQRPLQDDERGLRRGLTLVRQDLPQRGPVDQFHDDGGTRRRFHVLVQPDHVRVIQHAQDFRLAAEHHGEPGIIQQVGLEVLDRDQRARSVVPGQEHVPEPARAEFPQRGVPRNRPLGHVDRRSSLLGHVDRPPCRRQPGGNMVSS